MKTKQTYLKVFGFKSWNLVGTNLIFSVHSGTPGPKFIVKGLFLYELVIEKFLYTFKKLVKLFYALMKRNHGQCKNSG